MSKTTISSGKRLLRSSSTIIKNFPKDGNKIGPIQDEDIPSLEPPSTPKKKVKRDHNVNKSPKSPDKVSFRQREAHLLEKFPIPSDLSLPESFTSLHKPGFNDALKYIITKDPSLYPLIISEPFKQFHIDEIPGSSDQEHFIKLCHSVIGQQVSGAAAKSIENKVVAVFNDEGIFPTPKELFDKDDQLLRSAGLSTRKTEYINEICKKFINKEISNDFFQTASDEEILERLISIKGIGEWSAKMFLVFGLHKLDVFAHDDLGVARGISRYLETRPELLHDAKKNVDTTIQRKKSKFDDGKKRDWKVIHDLYVQHIAQNFAPFRSAFMLICWRASSTNIDILS
ncbi:Endonuclease III-like protein 1 [Wickerhamomyces ciferrii]|uniref:Endonuclease III-like protein 1 n=1 Tax=Wickerhamomyces ciferrii (strain ATCC 14091 / BCRC 22168 / CBS 111 / JCM 3599 / NBRC 0793 / NRRL Y-1031 F-60-10) TaxID=1206466 RepID=K0KQ14_WICCF|nr:Endonuclease III-like protein 1 [Wickerhamomyces ciferrii]CCH45131.1 Endonuclease III-like protein 1 [Wickerhamomyces ciferrii]